MSTANKKDSKYLSTVLNDKWNFTEAVKSIIQQEKLSEVQAIEFLHRVLKDYTCEKAEKWKDNWTVSIFIVLVTSVSSLLTCP
jgi:hypothetical protein